MESFEYMLWNLTRSLMDFVEANSPDYIDPYIEAIESEEGINLICELEGVNPEDIKVSVGDNFIKISVFQSGRIVYSNIFKFKTVSPKHARISFTNDILNIKVPFEKFAF